MTEREKLVAVLSLKKLKPFISPRSFPPPSVDGGTRCALEQFRSFTLKQYYIGLSSGANQLTKNAIRNVVTKQTYNKSFSMVKLDGYTSSKCMISTRKTRASQPTMVDLGRMINDLPDLEGKEGKDIIEACLSWYQLRLEEGIEIITDSWHKRFYWCNSGGSHHMAKLCYELHIQDEEWCPTVYIREYSLNLKSLKSLEGKVSIFVVMREKDGFLKDRIYNRLPDNLLKPNILERLGVAVPFSEYGRFPLDIYQLVIIDHSREYSDIIIDLLSEAVEAGLAMSFLVFLKSWVWTSEKRHKSTSNAQVSSGHISSSDDQIVN